MFLMLAEANSVILSIAEVSRTDYFESSCTCFRSSKLFVPHTNLSVFRGLFKHVGLCIVTFPELFLSFVCKQMSKLFSTLLLSSIIIALLLLPSNSWLELNNPATTWSCISLPTLYHYYQEVHYAILQCSSRIIHVGIHSCDITTFNVFNMD